MSTETTIREVSPEDRASLTPILERSFEGLYLWHSKKTLSEVQLVKAAYVGQELSGLIMLKNLDAHTGYVYYIAVLPQFRNRGVGGILLDHATEHFDAGGSSAVYATVEEDNAASLALFESRGFVRTGLGEMASRHGRLKAISMVTKMYVVPGEVVLRRDSTAETARPDRKAISRSLPPTGTHEPKV